MKFKDKKTNDVINFTSPDFIDRAKKDKNLVLMTKQNEQEKSNINDNKENK